MNLKLLSCVLLIYGLCGFAVSAFYAYETYDTLGRAVQTKAVVIGIYWDDTSEGRTAFPVLRFVDAEGVEHTAKTRVGFNINLPSIGDEWDIWYDPGNPEGGFWTFWDFWLFTPFLLSLHFCLLAAGLILFVKSKRKERIEGDFSICRGCNSHPQLFSIAS